MRTWTPFALLLGLAACGDDEPAGAGGTTASTSTATAASGNGTSGTGGAATGAGGGDGGGGAGGSPAAGTGGGASEGGGGSGQGGGGSGQGGSGDTIETLRLVTSSDVPYVDHPVFVADAAGEVVEVATTDAEGRATVDVPDGGSLVVLAAAVDNTGVDRGRLTHIVDVPPGTDAVLVLGDAAPVGESMTIGWQLSGAPDAATFAVAFPCYFTSAAARTGTIEVPRCPHVEDADRRVVATARDADGRPIAWGEAAAPFVGGASLDVPINLDRTDFAEITITLPPDVDAGQVQVAAIEPVWNPLVRQMGPEPATLQMTPIGTRWDLRLLVDLGTRRARVLADALPASFGWEVGPPTAIGLDPPTYGPTGPEYTWSTDAIGDADAVTFFQSFTDTTAEPARQTWVYVVAPADAAAARLPALPEEILTRVTGAALPDFRIHSATYVHAGGTYADHLALGSSHNGLNGWHGGGVDLQYLEVSETTFLLEQ